MAKLIRVAECVQLTPSPYYVTLRIAGERRAQTDIRLDLRSARWLRGALDYAIQTAEGMARGTQ